MTRKDEAGPKSAARFLARPLIVAVAVVIVIAIYISVIRPEPPTAVEDLDALPTGAGSLPDGPVDEQRGGLRNETAPDDFIDDSSQGDLRPEILDPERRTRPRDRCRGPRPARTVQRGRSGPCPA
jgi:hypothetical protein